MDRRRNLCIGRSKGGGAAHGQRTFHSFVMTGDTTRRRPGEGESARLTTGSVGEIVDVPFCRSKTTTTDSLPWRKPRLGSALELCRRYDASPSGGEPAIGRASRGVECAGEIAGDRKSTRLNSSH